MNLPPPSVSARQSPGFNFVSELWIRIILLVLPCSANASTLAFPGAEGWAAATPGGRGGDVRIVSNLNPSGPGSLAAALAASGPRTVVFEVGGVIDLKGATLFIDNSYITVAGETAPYPGITLIDGSLVVRYTHDVVIRHLRVRPGATRHAGTFWEPDAITVDRSRRVIIDHCSVSWAVDENLTVTGPPFTGSNPDQWRQNQSLEVTLSNNLIAEGLFNATHSDGAHSRGTLIMDNVNRLVITRNLYAHNDQRNPLFKAGSRAIAANNLIYNPGLAAMHYAYVPNEWAGLTPEPALVSAIGNVFQVGPDSFFFPSLFFKGDGPMQGYFEDNLRLNRSGFEDPNIYEFAELSGIFLREITDPSTRVPTPPISHSSVIPMPSDQVQPSVINRSGARPWEIDPVDARIKAEVITLTGRIINSENDVGGFPSLPATSRQPGWDTDRDGIPDDWERLRGLNPGRTDSNRYDLSTAGYTNLEMYLIDLNAAEMDTSNTTLSVVNTPAGLHLRWERLAPGMILETSTNLVQWDPFVPDPSISGQRPIPPSSGAVFYRARR